MGTGDNEHEVWRPGRERVGWVVDDDLFLDPEASYAAGQAMGRDTGDPLALLPRTLHRRLRQAGLLRSVEDDRHRLTVRHTLDGARRAVLHLAPSVRVGVSQTSQTSQTSQEGDGPAGAGPFAWASPRPAAAQTSHPGASETVQFDHGGPAVGPVGTFGTLVAGKEDRPEASIAVAASEDTLIEAVRRRLAVGQLNHGEVQLRPGSESSIPPWRQRDGSRNSTIPAGSATWRGSTWSVLVVRLTSTLPMPDVSQRRHGPKPSPDPLVAALARYVEALDRRYPSGPEQMRREAVDARANMHRMLRIKRDPAA